jgi:hypothetical protein
MLISFSKPTRRTVKRPHRQCNQRIYCQMHVLVAEAYMSFAGKISYRSYGPHELEGLRNSRNWESSDSYQSGF